MRSAEAGVDPDEADLVRECRRRAIDLLCANLGPAGILAATPTSQARERRYDAVFARDAAVCALAVLLGLADAARAQSIVRALTAAGVDAVWPVRAVCRPVAPGSRFWRTYMGRHRQNLVWQYHNGGCWPFIGGFWVMTLAALGEHKRAAAALVQLARANAVDDWAFTEWFHGQTGDPRGMRGQSWSAAMFLLAEEGLRTRIF